MLQVVVQPPSAKAVPFCGMEPKARVEPEHLPPKPLRKVKSNKEGIMPPTLQTRSQDNEKVPLCSTNSPAPFLFLIFP